jgi:hypothetical protein
MQFRCPELAKRLRDNCRKQNPPPREVAWNQDARYLRIYEVHRSLKWACRWIERNTVAPAVIELKEAA